MTPDDESDLEALKVFWWYCVDLGIWQEFMEYLYRTARTQEDFKELLMLHRLNQHMRTTESKSRTRNDEYKRKG